MYQQCFAEKNKDKKFKCSQLLEGDGIESRLPFKIFSTLPIDLKNARVLVTGSDPLFHGEQGFPSQ